MHIGHSDGFDVYEFPWHDPATQVLYLVDRLHNDITRMQTEITNMSANLNALQGLAAQLRLPVTDTDWGNPTDRDSEHLNGIGWLEDPYYLLSQAEIRHWFIHMQNTWLSFHPLVIRKLYECIPFMHAQQ